MRLTRRQRWLVVVLIAVALAPYCVVFLRPTAPKKVFASQCMGRLRTLGRLAILYADDHQQSFPVAEGAHPRAHESFQVLIDALPAGEPFDTITLVCPGSTEVQAVPGSDGRVHLTEMNVSYAWRAKPLKATGSHGSKIVLACEKTLEHRHAYGVNVLYIDGAVKFFLPAELGEGGLDGFIARNELSK